MRGSAIHFVHDLVEDDAICKVVQRRWRLGQVGKRARLCAYALAGATSVGPYHETRKTCKDAEAAMEEKRCENCIAGKRSNWRQESRKETG